MQTRFTVLSTAQLQTLGSRLAELRRGKGATAVEVATKVLGYSNGSHVAVTRLERGLLVRPRLDHLQALAAYYSVTPEHLFIPMLEAGDALPGSSGSPSTPVCAGSLKSAEPAEPAEPVDLAGRVRGVRVEAGLAPAEFANSLRNHGALILEGDVLAWESGAATPNHIQLRALCRFSKRTDGWFLRGEGASVAESLVSAARWLQPGGNP